MSQNIKRIIYIVAGLLILAGGIGAASTYLKNNQKPATEAGAGKASGEGVAGGESGGKPEGGSSTPSVTDPGGLSPSPSTNDPTLSNLGEEKMITYRDSQGRYQLLLVDNWAKSTTTPAYDLTSTFKDRSVAISKVVTSGKSAIDYATADEATVRTSLSGYKQLALKPGTIPYGAVVSLIYQYQAGQNPATGKPANFIAARIYVPKTGTQQLAVITVSGPEAFYGDLTSIFDPIVRSFKWL